MYLRDESKAKQVKLLKLFIYKMYMYSYDALNLLHVV